jgi:hypothetical protein
MASGNCIERRYGRLIVIGTRKGKRGQTVCDCLCDCGNHKNGVDVADLNRSHTTSCGCYNREKTVERNKKYTRKTHGMSNTEEYRSWNSMMQRCYSPKHEAYERYGGKGIVVCDKWHNFENFLADMGERPKGKTLDRIDNIKGYNPENCRWSDRLTQTRNRSTTITLEFKGETKTLQEWADEKGLPYALLRTRLRKLGWSVERALTVKDGRRKEVCYR